MRSRPIATRGAFLLAAAAALIVAAFVAVPAEAAKLYGCLGKHGSAHLYTKKPKKCKKGERLVSWNYSGAAGHNGKNGVNGTNGANGAPGQPQKALAFKVEVAGKSVFGQEDQPAFALGGVTVRMSCAWSPAAVTTELGEGGQAPAQIISGQVNTNIHNGPTEQVQQSVFDVPGAGGPFARLESNHFAGPLENVAHVNASITTPSAVIVLDAYLTAGGTPDCTAQGVAYAIPL